MKKGLISLIVLVVLFTMVGCLGEKTSEKEAEITKRVVRTDSNGFQKSFDVVFFRGTANAWGISAMDLVGDFTWEINVTFGETDTERFKFDVVGDWTVNYGDNGGDGTLELAGSDILAAAGASYTITLNDNTMTYTITQQELPSKVEIDYSIIGSYSGHKKLRDYKAKLYKDLEFLGEYDIVADEDDNTHTVIENLENGSYVLVVYAEDLNYRGTTAFAVTDINNQIKTNAYITMGYTSGYDSTYTQVNFRGTANDWVNSEMTLVSDYIWKIDVEFGESGEERFKFDIFGDWRKNFGDRNVDGYCEEAGEDILMENGEKVSIFFNSGTLAYYIKEQSNAVGEALVEFKINYNGTFYKSEIAGMNAKVYKDDVLQGDVTIEAGSNMYANDLVNITGLENGSYKVVLDELRGGIRFSGEVTFDISEELNSVSELVEIEIIEDNENVVATLDIIDSDSERNSNLIGLSVSLYGSKDGPDGYYGYNFGSKDIVEGENGEPVAKFSVMAGNYKLAIYRYYEGSFIYTGEKLFAVTAEDTIVNVDLNVSEDYNGFNVTSYPQLENGNAADLIGKEFDLYKGEELISTEVVDSQYIYMGQSTSKINLKVKNPGTYTIKMNKKYGTLTYIGEASFTVNEIWETVSFGMDVTTEDENFAHNFDNIYLRGTPNDWTTDSMELVADNTWEIKNVIFGNSENERFKFDIFGDWTENYGDTDGDGVLELSGEDIIAVANTTYDITLNDETMVYTMTSNGTTGSAVIKFIIQNAASPFEHFALSDVPVKLYKDGEFTVHNIVTQGYGQGINPKITLTELDLGEYKAVVDSEVYTGEISFTLSEEEPHFEEICYLKKRIRI